MNPNCVNCGKTCRYSTKSHGGLKEPRRVTAANRFFESLGGAMAFVLNELPELFLKEAAMVATPKATGENDVTGDSEHRVRPFPVRLDG